MEQQDKTPHSVYSDADNEVYSAFTLTQFPYIRWEMIDTSSFDKFYGVDQLVTATTNNGKEETYNVELKMRPFPAFDVKYIKDCFLEVDRFRKFKRDGINHKNLYIAIYPYIKNGGYIFVWDLTNYTEEDLAQYRTTKIMAAATCKDRNKKIPKEVFELPTTLAKMYRFDSASFYEGKDLK